MKTKYLFFFIVLFVWTIFPLSAQIQQIQKEGIITVEEYCSFLNNVASSDCYHLYEEAGNLILRSGESGNYYYEVISQAEGCRLELVGPDETAAASQGTTSTQKESFDAPINFLNADNVEAYCNWKNQDSSSSSFLIPVFGECDKELKSNQITFQILDQLEKKEASNNTTWFESIQHFMSSSVAFGMIFDPAIIRSSLQRNKDSARLQDVTLQDKQNKEDIKNIIHLAILRDNNEWENLFKEVDDAYESAHEAFFNDQLKTKEDLHAAEQIQESAHDYGTRREEAEKNGVAGRVVEGLNAVASNSGGGVVSVAATVISATVQVGSSLRKTVDETIVKTFDEHLQTSVQALQVAKEKTAVFFSEAFELEKDLSKRVHKETDELAKNIQLNHSRLEEWATAIIDQAKVDRRWKPEIIQADAPWMDGIITHAWNLRIKQSEDYLQHLHDSDEKEEVKKSKEKYEVAFETAKQAQEALRAIERVGTATLQSGKNNYNEFVQTHQKLMEQIQNVDLDSEINIDEKFQGIQNKLERTGELHKAMEDAMKVLKDADSISSERRKEGEEKIAILIPLFEEYFRKHDLFSKKIARAERRLEMDRAAKEKYWPEINLNIHQKNRTWGKAFAEARRNNPQTKEAWEDARDEAEKVKALYDRVIEKYKNREDLRNEYEKHQREKNILENKIAIALERINSFEETKVSNPLEEPNHAPRGAGFLSWKPVVGIIFIFLHLQSYPVPTGLFPATLQDSSWSHHLQSISDFFVAQTAANDMHCKPMADPTIEPPQKEPELIAKPKKEPEQPMKESVKKPSRPIQYITKKKTIVKKNNFNGPVVFGGNVNIHHR